MEELSFKRMNIKELSKKKISSENAIGYKRTIWYDKDDNIIKFLDNRSNDQEFYYDNKRLLHYIDFKNKYEFRNHYDINNKLLAYYNNKGEKEGLIFDILDSLNSNYNELNKSILNFLIESIKNLEFIIYPDSINYRNSTIEFCYNYNKSDSKLIIRFSNDKFVIDTNIESIKSKYKNQFDISNHLVDITIINMILDAFLKENIRRYKILCI